MDSKRCLAINYRLFQELDNIREEVSAMGIRLATLEDQFPESVEIKEVSLKEARKTIEAFLKKYFTSKRQVYPSDVADALGLRYEIVREVFGILEKEGKIRESR